MTKHKSSSRGFILIFLPVLATGDDGAWCSSLAIYLFSDGEGA
jgi:hypothetical protein